MHHTLNLRKPLAFFDLETTGINLLRDRIVEISIAKAMPDGEVQVKTKRINPGIPIPLEASLIHGIYDNDVANEPLFKQIARSMAQFLDGCDLAGFNSNRFDVPMLVEEFLRSEVEFDLKNRRLVDVQRIYHLMEPRTLTAAYKFYCGKILEGAHSAEVDTLATLEILNAQVERYDGAELKDSKGNPWQPVQNDVEVLHATTSSQIVDFAQRMILNKEGQEVFNFGKHSGKLVTDVLQAEPSYYDWMMKGDFPLDTKRKLTEIKLRNFNNRNSSSAATNGNYRRN